MAHLGPIKKMTGRGRRLGASRSRRSLPKGHAAARSGQRAPPPPAPLGAAGPVGRRAERRRKRWPAPPGHVHQPPPSVVIAVRLPDAAIRPSSPSVFVPRRRRAPPPSNGAPLPPLGRAAVAGAERPWGKCRRLGFGRAPPHPCWAPPSPLGRAAACPKGRHLFLPWKPAAAAP